MTTYDLGDGVNLRYFAYNSSGALTDATVTLSITKPDGTSTTVPNTRVSLGQYDSDTYVPAAVGYYTYRWTATGAVTDVSTGNFAVADPAPALYAPLPMVKAQLNKLTADDRDDLIEMAIRAASRKIDQITGRRFYADRVASARVYSVLGRTFQGPYGIAVMTDDIATATGLLVEGGTSGVYSSLSTFDTGPDNAIVMGQPITYVQADSTFFTTIRTVRVTARWGWPIVPDEVQSATMLLAARLYRRKDSPQGVIGSADWGMVRVSRVDPDVEALISHLILPGFA